MLKVIKKIVKSIITPFINYLRERYKKKKQKLLKNKNPTIISNNCLAGVVSKDLNLKFNTPTINLYFSRKDFIKYITYLKDYSNGILIEKKETDKNFPVGILKCFRGEIEINFMHYHSFEEAEKKWIERTTRIDYNNIFIIMEITEDDKIATEKFNELNYKNKVIITSDKFNYSACSFKMVNFYNENYSAGKILLYKNLFCIKRFVDKFDIVQFLNSGIISGSK